VPDVSEFILIAGASGYQRADDHEQELSRRARTGPGAITAVARTPHI
jgi:hypothetical protein